MRQAVTSERLQEFIEALGRQTDEPARVFLVGGATAVLLGWRRSTVDIDLKLMPETDELFRQLSSLKDKLGINIELASPGDFIPELPGWQERSKFICQSRNLTFLHYDFYSQTLAKIERGHEMDWFDVRNFIGSKLVETEKLFEFFVQIEGELHKYPAIDPASFRRAVESVIERPTQNDSQNSP